MGSGKPTTETIEQTFTTEELNAHLADQARTKRANVRMLTYLVLGLGLFVTSMFLSWLSPYLLFALGTLLLIAAFGEFYKRKQRGG
jgi:hypothetical protein